MKKIVYLILGLLPVTVQAQFLQNGNGIGIHYTAGKVVKHTKEVYIAPPTYSQVIEINYSHQTDGKKMWEQKFGLPQYGVAFTAINYLRKDMGNVYSLVPTIQFKLNGTVQNNMYIKMGAGLAYATKHWQRLPFVDTLNNFLGSAVNLFATVEIGKTITLHNNWKLDLGASLSHVSNAGTKKPNYGINLFGVYAGVSYKTMPKFAEKTNYQTNAHFGLGLKSGIAINQYNGANGPMLPNYNLSINAYKIAKEKNKLFIGFEYNYSKRVEFFIRETYQNVKNIHQASTNLSFTMGNEFLLGHFSIPTLLGFNVYQPYYFQKKMYEKFGIYYYPYKNKSTFLKSLYIGELLKVYYFKAEYLETCLGIDF